MKPADRRLLSLVAMLCLGLAAVLPLAAQEGDRVVCLTVASPLAPGSKVL